MAEGAILWQIATEPRAGEMRKLVIAVSWAIGLAVIAAAAALLLVGGQAEKNVQIASADGPMCPPALMSPPRAAGAPVDDVLGLRPGLLVGDAEALLRCEPGRLKLQFEPFWHTLVRDAGDKQRQLLHAVRDGERISAGLVGAYGDETIYAVWRVTSFPTDEGPTMSEAEGRLVTLYGAPHWTETTKLRRRLVWAWDAAGAPLVPPKAPEGDLVKQVTGWFQGGVTAEVCARHAHLSPLNKPTWNKACGLTIQAEIEGRVEEPTKTANQKLAVVEQTRLAQAVAAFRAAQQIPDEATPP